MSLPASFITNTNGSARAPSNEGFSQKLQYVIGVTNDIN
jgi:hypothetical protein